MTQDFQSGFDFNWWVLLLIPVIALLGFARGRRGTYATVAFSSLHVLSRLGKRIKSKTGRYRLPILLFITLLLGILALGRPQLLRRYKLVKESGVEMIIAVDVSRSMLVTDMILADTRVNRLTAARKVIRDFIRRRPMDRIGLVAFAGRPYLASPITLDHEWVINSLEDVRIGLVEDGTAIGSAIAASARRLDRREAKSKVVVLLTDGANNAGNLDPAFAAKMAERLSVKIYTIAVGTPGRHEIPTPRGMRVLDQEFDEETLKAIADAANGKFFRAEDTGNLEQIFADIDQLEKTERKVRMRTEFDEYWVDILLRTMIAFALFTAVANETFLRRSP